MRRLLWLISISFLFMAVPDTSFIHADPQSDWIPADQPAAAEDPEGGEVALSLHRSNAIALKWVADKPEPVAMRIIWRKPEAPIDVCVRKPGAELSLFVSIRSTVRA